MATQQELPTVADEAHLRKVGPQQAFAPWDYERLKRAIRGERLPAVMVDLDRFDANVRAAVEKAAEHGKTLRPASKSIRVPDLLRRVFEVGGSAVRGVMCFSASEASNLAERGFDDLLVAYPVVHPADMTLVAESARLGKKITLTIDCVEHARRLAELWNDREPGVPLRVCIEADVSWRPWGMHIGAQRSPIRSLGALEELLDELKRHPQLSLAGIMAYEAHLAGVPDANPFTPLKNLGAGMMRSLARKDLAKKREEISQLLVRCGIQIEFFNGGGTGWLSQAAAEPWLTEVTCGSGFLQPHLFDYYRGASRQPAFLFALEVTRLPQPDRVTCLGGGFIASGPPGSDRAPIPVEPAGLAVDPHEGFGEVQTPLIVPPHLQGKLNIGDPIFFRPAKAGEIAERFDEYLLVRDYQIVGRAKTYRGLGSCFH